LTAASPLRAAFGSGARSGSQQTRRWRKADLNRRSLSRTRRSFGTVPRGDRRLGSRQWRQQPNAYAPDPSDVMRAGLPRAVAPTGTSRVTPLPALITALSPMVTPGKMIAPPPIHAA
jgi:hypothetical protein